MKEFMMIFLILMFFILQLSLGGIGLRSIQMLTGGDWLQNHTIPLRRQVKLVFVLPVMVVLLLISASALFPWAKPDVWRIHPEFHHKTVYFSSFWSWFRAVVYLTFWLGAAYYFFRRKPAIAPGWILAVLFFTIHWAAVDWLMSLDIEWYSSIFPCHVAVSSMLTAMAALLLKPPESPEKSNTMAKILLVLVMVWTYFQFSQYIIIWSAQIPHEEKWYADRNQGAFFWLTLAVFTFQFALPFLLLLFKRIRSDAALVRWIAVMILAARLLEISWWVLPSVVRSS